MSQNAVDTIKTQLLEAYIAREAADTKIKALLNMLAGINLAAPQQQQPAATEAAPDTPTA